MKSIKLKNLSVSNLSEKQMLVIRAGVKKDSLHISDAGMITSDCGCACQAYNSKSSCKADNFGANSKKGLYSPSIPRSINQMELEQLCWVIIGS